MRSILVVGAPALALVVLACGGSRLSHAKFVERANAICSDYRTRADRVPLEHTVNGYEQYATQTLPLYRDALQKLEQLRPPTEDQALVTIWLARDRAIAADIERIAATARARDVVKLNAAVAKARADGRRSADLALQIGLDACAQT